jgi:predicted AAA+ superfamily ATPase
MNNISIDDRLTKLCDGGWPFLIGESDSSKKRIMKEYVESLYTDNLLRIDGVVRDSKIGANLLMSFSRNIGTSVSFETLLKDMKIHDTNITRQTLSSYYNALERIHIIEDLPA